MSGQCPVGILPFRFRPVCLADVIDPTLDHVSQGRRLSEILRLTITKPEASLDMPAAVSPAGT
jgi:hypothetical protein